MGILNTQPAQHFFREPRNAIGTKLKNGATVMLAHNDDNWTYVLCHWNQNSTPFVVWRLDEHGNAHSGDYCSSFSGALNALKERAGVESLGDL